VVTTRVNIRLSLTATNDKFSSKPELRSSTFFSNSINVKAVSNPHETVTEQNCEARCKEWKLAIDALRRRLCAVTKPILGREITTQFHDVATESRFLCSTYINRQMKSIITFAHAFNNKGLLAQLEPTGSYVI